MLHVLDLARVSTPDNIGQVDINIYFIYTRISVNNIYFVIVHLEI